jgi:hypothetical protein
MPVPFVFRRLADISRSTRGVILLICNLQTAKQVTTEAKRLNMMSGHFVWLWIDTGASTTLEIPINNPFPADDNTGNDISKHSPSVDNHTATEQQITSRSRFRPSTNKRRERESGDKRNQWDPSSCSVTNFMEGQFPTSNPKETSPDIRKARASEGTMKETSGSVQDIKTSDLFSSTTKRDSGRIKSQRNSSGSLRTSSQRENAISDHVTNSNKETLTRAASRGTGFDNLGLIHKSHESSTHYIKNTEKDSAVPLLGQDRIGDHINFRDTKLRPDSVQNVRSAGDGWIFQEKRSSENMRLEVNLPGLNKEGEDEDVEESLPVGLLAMRTQAMRLDRNLVKGAVRLMADTLLRVLTLCADWMPSPPSSNNSCWTRPSESYRNFSSMVAR